MALNPPPAAVTLMWSNGQQVIALDEIRQWLDLIPKAFVHFRKVLATAGSRLYIPCHLVSAAQFSGPLWLFPSLTAFKIVGYGDAIRRADVIIAWFQHTEHARAAGQILENMFANHMSGRYPVGAYPCSNAHLCGWALEVGSSVGTDAVSDLAGGMDERSRVREAPF
jgi:hypothetical protein